MQHVERELQIYRDGHVSKRYLRIPLMDGFQGNFQTVAEMAKIVREDRKAADLRNFVLREIVGNVRGHDFDGEVGRIFDFCQRQITYRKDPWGVERVADIWSTLYALNANGAEGDCGIKSTFFASCCAMLGHKPFFILITQSKDQTAFNHIYNAVLLNGQLRYFDATPNEAPPGWEAQAHRKYIYRIF